MVANLRFIAANFVKAAEALINSKRFQEATQLLREGINSMPSNWKPFSESPDRYHGFFWYTDEFLSFVEYYRSDLIKGVIMPDLPS